MLSTRKRRERGGGGGHPSGQGGEKGRAHPAPRKKKMKTNVSAPSVFPLPRNMKKGYNISRWRIQNQGYIFGSSAIKTSSLKTHSPAGTSIPVYKVTRGHYLTKAIRQEQKQPSANLRGVKLYPPPSPPSASIGVFNYTSPPLPLPPPLPPPPPRLAPRLDSRRALRYLS